MARSAYRKDIVRSIRHSIGRFVAIAIIAALGTGFYSGLRMCGPDMELAADEYYDATNLSDIRVVSTLGFDDESIAELAAIEGVSAASGERELDVLATIDNVQYAVRVHGIDMDAARASDTSDGLHAISDDEQYMNRPLLVEGTWPDEPGECLLSADAVLESEIEIGDTVTFVELSDGSDLEDSFSTTEYTVTGFARMSYYVNSSSLGSTTLSTGTINDFMIIADSDFAEDLPYTGAFITVEGAREELAGSDAYDALVDAVEERILAQADEIALNRLERLKAEAQATLDEETVTFETERADALAQLDEAQAELDSAWAVLRSAAAQLEDALAEIESGRAQIASAEAQLESTRQTLEESQEQIDEGWAQYESGVAELEAQKVAVYAELDQAQAQLDEWAATVDPNDEQGQAMIAAAQAEIDTQRAAADATFTQAQTQLDATADQLSESQQQIDEGWEQYRAGLAALEASQQLLESGISDYQSGLLEYESGLSEYESGYAEYIAQRDDALAQLEDAQAQINDAQAEIDSIESPEIYVLDNHKNYGVETYGSDAVRIDHIAQVFPAVFFLVAALVSLTTMTRMVDEERILIGTYKALGYSNGTIIAKYLIYALLASGIGSVVGILTLTQLLPKFIMSAYSIVYIVPATPTPIDVPLALLSATLGIGITLLATLWAAASSLREKPAYLMLPRVPKAGQRIFLERIKPIWKRMSFSWKVTARNIFRYKKRFFMAIIGIAGCTALLLTGFGLQDSINDIINKQYENEDCVVRYNFTVTLDDDISDSDLQSLFQILDEDERIENYELLHSENMVVSDGEDTQQRVNLEAPFEGDDFGNYIMMRDRITKESIALESDSVVITEKLASKFGLSVGDQMIIYEEDTVGNAVGDGYTVTVGGIMENYVDAYVYLYPSLYEETFGETCTFNTVIMNTVDGQSDRMDLSDDILAIDGVSTASYVDEAIKYYREALSSVDSVVVVLILAAAALAFVVLYNLTNINIAERQREIATLKVLGFTNTEYTLYIFREIFILSLIGAIIGLLIGVLLENFVVTTVEVDAVMFGRSIHLTSFLYSFLLAIVFTVIITIGMRYKLVRISMVESLKSVE